MIDQTMTPSLIDLCPTHLKKVSNTGGGEYHGACPVCGGKDRFVVQPNAANGGKWFCRRCGNNGDTIAFCEFALGDDFKRACERLGINTDQQPQLPQKREPVPPPPPVNLSTQSGEYAALEPDWQTAAAKFMTDSVDLLWSADGKPAMRYLTQRGLRYSVLRRAWIGYNAKTHRAQWGNTEVWLPRGITIGWIKDGNVRKVNIRRSNYDMDRHREYLIQQGKQPDHLSKYIQAAGGITHDLYHVKPITPDKPAVMVETELDALLLQSFGNSYDLRFVAVAVGSSCNGLTAANVALLATAQHVYGAFDYDDAGYKAFLKWQYALGKRHCSRMTPEHKDPGETYSQWGRVGVRRWLVSRMNKLEKSA